VKRKLIPALLAYALSVGIAAAQEQVFVEALLPGKNGKLAAFDEKGAKIAEYAPDAFETPPFPARGYDRKTRKVKVAVSGREVWLSPFEVKTSEKAGVLTDCEVIQRATGQKMLGSRGVGEKC
jgi:hypothetical protein